jgi:shikimate kinase
MSEKESRPIALVGMMGAGKSAVARLLGERLGASVADLDSMIEAVEGRTIAQLFADSGEAWFRRREGELLAQVLRQGVRVIACGGGIVTRADLRRELRARCTVVWLEASPAESARRMAAGPESPARDRPLLTGADPVSRLRELLAEREASYAEVAHVRVPTDGRDAAAVADAVLAAVAGLA